MTLPTSDMRAGHPLDPDQHVAVTSADVTDAALLPWRVEMLSREVRELLDAIKHSVVPGLGELKSAVLDLRSDVAGLAVSINRLAGRVDKLEDDLVARVTALEEWRDAHRPAHRPVTKRRKTARK